MAPEETTPTEAEVKPAAPAKKQRTPRKKAAATKATGEAGAPAASAESAAPAAPARKQRAPRKKTTKPAAETPAPAEKPAEQPAAPAPAPAPVEKPAEAPDAPATEQTKQEKQPRKDRPNHHKKDRKPENQQQAPQQTAPAPVAEKPAQPERASDIENPDAAPQLPPAPGFAAPETVGGNEGGSNSRRKRRRNRNRNRENGQQPQQPQATPQVDKEELVRRAWKIFLGEVTEEGLALMDDRTAAEASRRAFRVAELFLIEAARHRPSAPVAEEMPEESETDSAEEMEQE